MLNISQPSVQMLHKLNEEKLVYYEKGNNTMKMTSEGEKIGEKNGA